MAIKDLFKKKEKETETEETTFEKKGIGVDEIKKARQTLYKYKSGKASIDSRCIENEKWWKLRQNIGRTDDANGMPVHSAWLWNTIVSKHADATSAYPEANFLPRAMDDKEEAERLTKIMPVVIERNNFENIYSDIQWAKLKQGTGIYGVFWDASLNNGLGDIHIKKQDILSIFYEPGVTDIQDSRNIFTEKLVDIDLVEEQYPEIKGKIKSANKVSNTYVYDDTVDTTGKCAVIDWYYKKQGILHYAKFVDDNLLFATENEPENYPNGWYEHGLYPFIFDNLFDVEGTPCGYGYIDIFKNTQEQIDRLSQASLRNALMAATPRYFIRSDGSVNEDEFANWTKPFVHTDGNLGDDSIRPIQSQLLNGNYLSLIDSKIAELKEASGNRDVSNGGSTSGVTAASAIAAMQEASGKLSRDSSRASYNAFTLVMEQCIALMRQFYDVPRQFRILGDDGQNEYIMFGNEGLKEQPQGSVMGADMGYRLPVFDIEVSAQRQTQYNKTSQNELALQLYQLGFFNPQMADQAKTTLEIMDFSHKDDIIQKIDETATMEGKLLRLGQLAMTMAQEYAPGFMPQIAEFLGLGVEGSQPAMSGSAEMPQDIEATEGLQKRNNIVENAREQAQERAMPEQ